jgi:F-box-like
MNSQALLDAEKALVALQDEEAKVSCRHQEVIEALALAKATYAKVHNEHAAISKIPDEILAEIFHLCQDSWAEIRSRGFGLKSFEIVASQVSSIWREVALGTQLFWSTINLVICPQTRRWSRELQRLETYLVRSGGHYLDIFMRVVDSGSLSEFLYPVATHSFRWRRISFTLTHEQHINDVYRSLYLVEAPTLEHLSIIRTPSPVRHRHGSTLEPILTFGASSLSFVRLSFTGALSIVPPLGDVTTLHIDSPTKDILTPERLQTLLGMVRRLVNLSLTGLRIVSTSEEAPISMPYLRSLRIRDNTTPYRHLLSLLMPDHLQSLSLHGLDTFRSRTVLSSVQSLTLESCRFPEVDLADIFRAFPAISSLSIDDCVPGVLHMLGVKHLVQSGWSGTLPLQGVLLPDLKTLSIRRLHPFLTMTLAYVVYDRRCIHAPISCVRLDAHSEVTLRGANVLSELSTIVDLEQCEQLEPWPADLGYHESSDEWVH